MEKERLLPKWMMVVNNEGVSFYQIGDKYFSHHNGLVKEISYELYEKEVIKFKAEIYG